MPARPRSTKSPSDQRGPLSVQRCRDILGTAVGESDLAIEQLRDQFYAIARSWIDSGAKDFRSSSAVLASLSEEDRAEVEERAAVMELDGGLTRSEAEHAAVAAFIRQRTGVH